MLDISQQLHKITVKKSLGSTSLFLQINARQEQEIIFYVYIYLFTNSQIQWRSYLWSPFGWMVLILFLPWRKSDEHEDIPETFFWELIIFIIIIRLYKRKLTQCNSDTYLTQWQQRYWSILHCNLTYLHPHSCHSMLTGEAAWTVSIDTNSFQWFLDKN